MYTISSLLWWLVGREKNVKQMFPGVTMLLKHQDKVRSNSATMFYGKPNALRISADVFVLVTSDSSFLLLLNSHYSESWGCFLISDLASCQMWEHFLFLLFTLTSLACMDPMMFPGWFLCFNSHSIIVVPVPVFSVLRWFFLGFSIKKNTDFLRNAG